MTSRSTHGAERHRRQLCTLQLRPLFKDRNHIEQLQIIFYSCVFVLNIHGSISRLTRPTFFLYRFCLFLLLFLLLFASFPLYLAGSYLL